MKKILSLVFFSLILVACSREEAEMPEEVQEPVTKIVHECQCPQDEAPVNAISEESQAVNSEESQIEEQQEPEVDSNLVNNDNEVESPTNILPDVTENPEINQMLPDGIGERESEVLNQVSTYTVLAGDTLTQIASRFGVTAAQIQSWNNLETVDSIYVGQTLNILGGVSNVPVMNSNNLNLANETIEYLLNGQANVRESERLNWNPTFLRLVNLAPLHQEFVASGGSSENMEAFATFVTENAPIQENWQELFKADFLETTGIQITNLTALDNDRYRAYIEENGIEVPEVIVSARTGFYNR